MVTVLSFLTHLWSHHAPELLLGAFFILYLTGYPVAFCLGALALLFALVGLETGLIGLFDLDALPSGLFTDILLDPALLSVPLLLLLAEILVETGHMSRASEAVKATFDPSLLKEREIRKSQRKIIIRSKIKSKPEQVGFGSHSSFVTIFVPGALLTIIVARQFHMPAELLTSALLLPIAVLSSFYLFNWLLGLWIRSDRKKTIPLAALAGSADEGEEDIPSRPWFRLIAALILPILAVVFGLVLLLHVHISIFGCLVLICLFVCLIAALQGRLSLMGFFSTANRAAIGTASLAAMLLASYCFHATFVALGGGEKLLQIGAFLLAQGTEEPWVMLLLFLAVFALLGLMLDWIIMALVLLPLLSPILAGMDFSAHLLPFWNGGNVHLAAFDPSVLSQKAGFGLETRIWFAALVWFSLITAMITYCRQNSVAFRRAQSTDADGNGNGHSGTVLFVTLQLIGLAATIIAPQTVLWLPAQLIG